MFLTPIAIGYLTQLILATIISAYLLWRLRRRPRPRHSISVTLFFIMLTGFISMLFGEASLLTPLRFYAVFLQVPLLSLAWFCLLDFAYQFTPLSPAMRTESRVALGLAALYIFWESGYAVFRFVQLHAGVVEYRIDWTDYLLLLYLLWPALIFARQMLRLVPPAYHGWRRVWVAFRHPADHEARALRTFTFITFSVIVLSLCNILRTFYLLSVALANLSIALGVLIALCAFALAYLNHRPESTSFIIKLSGVTLTTMLATCP